MRMLADIRSPRDLAGLSIAQLEDLAQEMREALYSVAAKRTAHFASNLGVVELCLALHSTFDFSRDRLIWDTGHQIYPHKLITGRYHAFDTLRTRGGLMGYPSPRESEYDLFMTGHAGCSISTILGLKSGDDLQPGEEDRRAVAVIGDGAFPSGIVYEAMNNAGGLRKNILVILNDNQMSICPRVGGLGEYLDKLRMGSFYHGLKGEVARFLNWMPLVGEPVEKLLVQAKDAVKAGLHGGMLFESLGFRYVGPVDGHNIAQIKKYLAMVQGAEGPVLMHVVTRKGHGFKPAEDDPVFFHTPAPFTREQNGVISIRTCSARAYTNAASEAIFDQMSKNPKVTVLTAAMCQGNKLETIRDQFPERFFDTGICEAHAVAFAAGQAKSGLRPIVDIYSTFLQRSYDQIFQEVALQDLPVIFMLDRAGLTGPDGPTHHGCFDIAYLRVLPNLVVMAPGDELDVQPMLEFALSQDSPASIRYPKANAQKVDRQVAKVERGRAEVIAWGADGMIFALGTLLPEAWAAVRTIRAEGFDVGLVNARFAKPLDRRLVLRATKECPFVMTLEEGCLMGGFGSAVLETVCDAGYSSDRIIRLGIPDRFIEHGERDELLEELGLTRAGIERACRAALQRFEVAPSRSTRRRVV